MKRHASIADGKPRKKNGQAVQNYRESRGRKVPGPASKIRRTINWGGGRIAQDQIRVKIQKRNEEKGYIHLSSMIFKDNKHKLSGEQKEKNTQA